MAHLPGKYMNQPQSIFVGDRVTSPSYPELGTLTVVETEKVEWKEGAEMVFYYRIRAEGDVRQSAGGAEHHFVRVEP